MTPPVDPEVLGLGSHLRLVRRDGWEYVEHVKGNDSVAAFATTRAGEAILIEQLRVPVGRRVLELPAGFVEPEETPEEAVVRELLEETGHPAAGPPELLIRAPLAAGVSAGELYLFRVHCGAPVSAGGGVDGEEIQVHLVPLAELTLSNFVGYQAIDWRVPAAIQLATR
jgi:ADP-ribose pyrophosphatase